jgi:hypothetical protein
MSVWTRLDNGCYRYRDTAYSVLREQGVGKAARWHVLRDGELLGIATEPTREFAGYAIDAEISESKS